MRTFFACVLICLTLMVSAQVPAPGYKPGDMATDFNLKNVDGKMVSLTEQKGAKGIVLVFTCNHCPYAQAYEQRIIDLHKKYASSGFPVIAINPNDETREPDDSYANMQKRAAEKKYPFSYLHDETQQVAKVYGATRTPHVYLLQRTSKGFVVAYVGTIDDNYEDPTLVKERYVEQAISELKAGKPVSVTSTKAIGCGIKWRKAN